ncbi:hypothetical protein MKY92_26550 [Paenibacillus sp. FSL R5-0623]|uniref:hypothetical protein n=1 Tax=Paenibacillus sp. FSL R5-0623 TaxID=2921651 RepID=UPI0030DCBCF6
MMMEAFYPGYCRSIETQKQLYILTEQGCNKVQGYYYSKPLPADEVKQIFFWKNKRQQVIQNAANRVSIVESSRT